MCVGKGEAEKVYLPFQSEDHVLSESIVDSNEPVHTDQH